MDASDDKSCPVFLTLLLLGLPRGLTPFKCNG